MNIVLQKDITLPNSSGLFWIAHINSNEVISRTLYRN